VGARATPDIVGGTGRGDGLSAGFGRCVEAMRDGVGRSSGGLQTGSGFAAEA
jgi:hypothetical protein